MLNIGFIGCGGIARHHAERLKNLKNARIVAASDIVGWLDSTISLVPRAVWSSA